MVSTLDSESSDPSSNLGGTYQFLTFIQTSKWLCQGEYLDIGGSHNAGFICNHWFLNENDTSILLTEKCAPDVGLEPTTLGLLELGWLASKSPMLYQLS